MKDLKNAVMPDIRIHFVSDIRDTREQRIRTSVRNGVALIPRNTLPPTHRLLRSKHRCLYETFWDGQSFRLIERYTWVSICHRQRRPVDLFWRAYSDIVSRDTNSDYTTYDIDFSKSPSYYFVGHFTNIDR
jgi:hypothetical protein